MSLHWYTCIYTNTCRFEMYHISLKTDWWALPNASLIVWIRSAVHEILADKVFTATDGLISQSFVVAFVHPAYVRIALIWGFSEQLSLWKSVHWLWRYKLNEVCDTHYIILLFQILLYSSICHMIMWLWSWHMWLIMYNSCDISYNSNIKIENSKLYLFLFSFLFSFLILDLELGFSIMSHMTITNCHT